jgi:transposase
MAGTTIIPDPMQVELRRLAATAKGITAVMRAHTTSSRCPVCDVPSARVHSRYLRQLADLPWCKSTVCLQLQVRRFFCDHPIYPRIIFTERLPGVVAPYARRTLRLARLVAVIGCLLGGSAGSRLLRRLASGTHGTHGTHGTLPPSRDTILRPIRRTVLPSPRVVETLSVDDFAFWRGPTYRTTYTSFPIQRSSCTLPSPITRRMR